MKLCRKWVKTLIYFCKKFNHRFLTEFQVNCKLGWSYVGIRRLRKVVVTNTWLYKGRVPIRLAVVSVENGLLQNFFRLYWLWKLKTIRIIKAMFSCEMYYNIYGNKVPVKLICFHLEKPKSCCVYMKGSYLITKSKRKKLKSKMACLFIAYMRGNA